MGFTSSSLILPETVTTAEVYLDLKDWKKVRQRVLNENLLQKNSKFGITEGRNRPR